MIKRIKNIFGLFLFAGAVSLISDDELEKLLTSIWVEFCRVKSGWPNDLPD